GGRHRGGMETGPVGSYDQGPVGDDGIHPGERRSVPVAFRPWADSTSKVGKMIMTGFAGRAGFGRDRIRKRRSAGRMVAKEKVRFGRPRKLSSQQAKLAKRLLDEGKLVSEIETFEVHVATIYRLRADQ